MPGAVMVLLEEQRRFNESMVNWQRDLRAVFPLTEVEEGLEDLANVRGKARVA